MVLKMGKVRFVCMPKKEKKLMMQEGEKRLARAESMEGRPEGLGSSAQGRPVRLQEKGRRDLWAQLLGWGGRRGGRDHENDLLAASVFSQNRDQSYQLRVGNLKEWKKESAKKM